MYRFVSRPLYMLPSISGKVKWVDYIPVKEATSGRLNSTDSLGSLEPSEILESVTGLTAWVDYIPAYVVADTIPWVQYLPMHEVQSYELLLENGTDKLLMESSGYVIIE